MRLLQNDSVYDLFNKLVYYYNLLIVLPLKNLLGYVLKSNICQRRKNLKFWNCDHEFIEFQMFKVFLNFLARTIKYFYMCTKEENNEKRQRIAHY